MIHGDVFRCPPMANLFAAFVGSGAQIFFTVLFLLLSVVVGAFKVTRRGALLCTFNFYFDAPKRLHILSIF